jgi:hypothetical protein
MQIFSETKNVRAVAIFGQISIKDMSNHCIGLFFFELAIINEWEQK